MVSDVSKNRFASPCATGIHEMVYFPVSWLSFHLMMCINISSPGYLTIGEFYSYWRESSRESSFFTKLVISFFLSKGRSSLFFVSFLLEDVSASLDEIANVTSLLLDC